jgi:type IV secretory pathway VirB2 component (pilin)
VLYPSTDSKHAVKEKPVKKKLVSLPLKKIFRSAWIPTLMLVASTPMYAQASGSPWEEAVTKLADSFQGPIARGLSLVAIVVGGLAFAFGEGDSKRMLAGIVFGLGMALGALQLMTWMFG